jgi:hypothetical protein
VARPAVVQPVSYPGGSEALFLGMKQPECEAHLTYYLVLWIRMHSILPQLALYTFLARCLDTGTNLPLSGCEI